MERQAHGTRAGTFTHFDLDKLTKFRLYRQTSVECINKNEAALISSMIFKSASAFLRAAFAVLALIWSRYCETFQTPFSVLNFQ